MLYIPINWRRGGGEEEEEEEEEETEEVEDHDHEEGLKELAGMMNFGNSEQLDGSFDIGELEDDNLFWRACDHPPGVE